MFALNLSPGINPHRAEVRMVRELGQADLTTTLALLATDPVRSILLRGLLLDNGFSPAANRGCFFGYFENKKLVGVALLGHATMIYTLPEVEANALRFFAKKFVERETKCQAVIGVTSQVEAFGALLAQLGRGTKRVRNLRWYTCQKSLLKPASSQLQCAKQENAEVVANAQAIMHKEETGIDPREKDPVGFMNRVAKRIERKRTWIKVEDDQVVFKSELENVTSEVAYLEGVWTREDKRSQGIAKSCLTELVHRLLQQKKVVCLAADEDEHAAMELYEKVGFVHTEDYQARYLYPASGN